ncbi:hypothetical protein HanXRQr2_Chr11g0490501 [Helianthus annuus]|uniref:Uncharacterized protein n=1 Tax=Helianthus annuus TaxID=4232 RepID=A0A9K3HPL9_HELAN|nr:hypothetical protein HanXRQr2_Chr11g0490501 [Helianthus annuus]KAJ0509370.1 hypothetical protein HanIR_Chr11g0528041 [Helianthus annuus]KAJ0875139.1 hypothetical protein HanPSC8_Chr11g0472641 [Helianthus annuus]
MIMKIERKAVVIVTAETAAAPPSAAAAASDGDDNVNREGGSALMSVRVFYFSLGWFGSRKGTVIGPVSFEIRVLGSADSSRFSPI